ncbi:MAG: GNAT family N-acetyltransferase [Phenylobacterium sp.]|nr:GNAT family N-acetyltransferase [Phenylobacterium sp.]
MIETERLILRQWREEDLAPFAAMSRDEEVMRWLGGVLTCERARAYMERAHDAFARLGMCRFAIERREDGAFVGARLDALVRGTAGSAVHRHGLAAEPPGLGLRLCDRGGARRPARRLHASGPAGNRRHHRRHQPPLARGDGAARHGL